MEYISYMPKQKLSERSKTKKWHKECIDSAMALIDSHDNTRRSTRYNKKINYDLAANIFHKEDLYYILNPLGLENNSMPAELRHYDLISPILNLLQGEEAARTFNFTVKAINEDAISSKENDVKQMLFEIVKQQIMAKAQPQVDENGQPKLDENGKPMQDPNVEEEMAKLQKFVKYEYQDFRERYAWHTINYLRRRLDFDKVLLDGWEDALIGGEEMYHIDIVAGEPTLRRCNPLEVFFVLPHNSYYLDDAEVIVEETWMSKSEIIDTFYEDLTEVEIDLIENQTTSMVSNSDRFNYVSPPVIYTSDIPVITDLEALHDYSSAVDSRGNIRVAKVTWKTRKKIGILFFVNPLTGEPEEMIVDDTYKPREEEGEMVEWMWINEYREGVKIGEEVYTRMRPCRVQRRHMDNLSICKSPYVGTVYGANNSVSTSVVDRLKTYQYLYDILFYRTELLLAKSLGQIVEFDLATIPTEYGFDIDKWMYYLQAMNISFKNTKDESLKGERLGLMQSGAQSTRSINMEQGQFIDKHIQLMQYIEGKIGELSGVTPQRKGQIGPSELVGNTTKSIIQSNYITEKMFLVHNHVKRRVLESLLDTAKVCWRGKTKRLQYITDDLGSIFEMIDGAAFDSAEYGLFVTNATKDNQTVEALKQLLAVGLQSDKLNYSMIMDVMLNENVADIRRKIETYEAAQMAAKQQEVQMQQEQQQAQLEQMREQKEKEMELKKYEIDADNETQIQVAEIKAFSFQRDLDVDGDGIPDPIEIAEQALKERQHDADAMDKEMGWQNKRKELDDKKSIEERKLDVKEKELKNKKEIEELKARSAEKVARTNKNKYDK